jgi:5-methylcytosine-specific restriction endonuclease McrA
VSRTYTETQKLAARSRHYKWRKAHPEQVNSSRRRRYGENKNHVNELKRAWRKRTKDTRKEKIKAERKRYYQKHREKRKIQAHNYYWDHRDTIMNKRKSSETKAKTNAWQREYRKKGKARDLEREYKEAILEFLIARDGFVCGVCGGALDTDKSSIDHIIPVVLGGPNSLDNFQAAHLLCNIRKNRKHG